MAGSRDQLKEEILRKGRAIGSVRRQKNVTRQAAGGLDPYPREVVNLIEIGHELINETREKHGISPAQLREKKIDPKTVSAAWYEIAQHFTAASGLLEKGFRFGFSGGEPIVRRISNGGKPVVSMKTIRASLVG